LKSLSIDLVHQQGGVKKLCKLLARTKDDKFLGLEMIEILVDVIWSKIYPRILAWVFLPFMIYFFSFILYVNWFFDPKKDNSVVSYVLMAICFVYSIRQLYYEVK
jgi:hypothetical protein